MTEVPEVDPREVGTRYLLDVREPAEWVQVRAAGAAHVPLGQLVARVEEVPRDQPVAVICHSGARSAQAAAWLQAQGYDAVNVAGGTEAWERLGLPVARG